jgi:hypothetical protein
MNKERHLVEIPEDVESAVVIVRHKTGEVGVITAKGTPHIAEVMALTFGVFCAFIQGAKKQGIDDVERIREAFKHQSLEDILDQLVKVAILVEHDMKEESHD